MAEKPARDGRDRTKWLDTHTDVDRDTEMLDHRLTRIDVGHQPAERTGDEVREVVFAGEECRRE